MENSVIFFTFNATFSVCNVPCIRYPIQFLYIIWIAVLTTSLLDMISEVELVNCHIRTNYSLCNWHQAVS